MTEPYTILSQWPTGCTRVMEASDGIRLQSFGPTGLQEVVLNMVELAALVASLDQTLLREALAQRLMTEWADAEEARDGGL